MPWMRHMLRDAQVWAEVDERGALVADSGGRVSVVYKRDPGAKIYKAGARNLGRVDGASVEADLGGGASASPVTGAGTSTSTSRSTSRGSGTGKRATWGDRLPADAIHVWTDGACTGNPGPAGLGVVYIDGDDRREHGEYLGQGTNNIAELTAILRGLDMVSKVTRTVLVYTDSAYSIGVLSQGWKAKANVDLIAEIRDRMTAFTDLRFVKVPGHAGVEENERCDELARGAITGVRRAQRR